MRSPMLILIIPLLILSSCTINWNDEKDRKIADPNSTWSYVSWEYSETWSNGSFWSGISLVQSGSMISLKINWVPIKKWELDPRDDIFMLPNATQKIRENLIILPTNNPNFITLHLEQNNFTYSYLFYNQNQIWLIDIGKNTAYTLYNIITNIEILSWGYLVEQHDISNGSGFLAFYHPDWSPIDGSYIYKNLSKTR